MVWLPFKSDVAISPDISTYGESLDFNEFISTYQLSIYYLRTYDSLANLISK
jgi:hypothetical protein